MDLEKQAHIVSDIRSELTSRLNTRLKIRANMGRSKIIECQGTLLQAHPSLFIMEIDRKRGRTARQSYQYVDILTGMVEMYDVTTGEPVFGSFLDEEDDLMGGFADDVDDEDESDDDL